MLRRIAIALAITIAALALIDRASLIVAPCGPGGGGYSDQKGYEDDNCATREGIVVAGIEWLRQQPPEVWAAISSILIAIFTGTLWYSTDKLWRAGERQIRTSRQIAAIQARQTRVSNREAIRAADAAAKGAKAAELNAEAVIDAARARIFVTIDRDTTDAIRAVAKYINSPEMDDGTVTTYIGLFYSFKNYGKTPAILKEISHQMILAPELAKVREYAPIVPLPVEHILSPGDKTPDETLTCVLPNKITAGDAKDIHALRNTVWFYGYISYDDTFGFGRELRYVFHYDGSTRGRFSLYSYEEIQSQDRH
jgi:hypothetical protein